MSESSPAQNVLLTVVGARTRVCLSIVKSTNMSEEESFVEVQQDDAPVGAYTELPDEPPSRFSGPSAFGILSNSDVFLLKDSQDA